MWQPSNPKVRSASLRRRERERARLPLHIKRIMARIELPSIEGTAQPSSEVRLVLNDLSETGAGLFSPNAFSAGMNVLLVIKEPVQLLIPCKIIWCQEHAADSHILSSQPFAYRVGVKFLLKDDAEKEQLKKFCELVQRDHIFKARSF